MRRVRSPLLRAALISTLIGHWIANAIADPGEYAAVGLRYEEEALRPILWQVAVVCGLVVALTLVSRLSAPRRRLEATLLRSRAAMTMMLAVLQISAFTAMEITERLALGESYSAAFRSGIFDRSFAVELTVAIVSALVVVALAIAVGRVASSVLSRAPAPPRSPVPPFLPRQDPWIGNVLALRGFGGVRAPPKRSPLS